MMTNNNYDIDKNNNNNNNDNYDNDNNNNNNNNNNMYDNQYNVASAVDSKCFALPLIVAVYYSLLSSAFRYSGTSLLPNHVLV